MKPSDNDILTRFAALFDGYTKKHGCYRVTSVLPNGKHMGDVKKDRFTANGPITPLLWKEHLDGSGFGLGVIMLRDDNTCKFAVIDVDDYRVDHGKIEMQIKRLKLPLVVCRSKSGGAHLYVFFKEPVSAKTVQTRLAEWTAAMGLSADTEQFPKQSERADEETDPGSWINIPYQNGNKTVRFAISNNTRLDLLDFIEHAEGMAVSETEMAAPYFKEADSTDTGPFWEAPPCLVAIQAQGGWKEEDYGNDGLMAVGVYLRKRFPESWPSKLREYNVMMCHPPFDEKEVESLEKSIAKKDYHYRCKLPPINAVCNRRVCLSRKYGIGDTSMGQGLVRFLGVTRYEYQAPDPPMWAFEINAKRVIVDNDTFYQRDALNRAIMAQANTIPLHMPPARWLKELNTLIADADVVDMPQDAGPTGQLWERVTMFLEQGVNALTREELLSGGKIWRNDGNAYFKGTDLFQYFEAHRVKYKTEQAVWQLLRDHGARQENLKIHNKIVRVWCLTYSNTNINFSISQNGTAPPLPTGEEF